VILPIAFIFLSAAAGVLLQTHGALILEVKSSGQPLAQVEVIAGGRTAVTDARGQAALQLPAGDFEVAIRRFGVTWQSFRASIVEGAETRVDVDLHLEAALREEVTVTATRTERRIDDTPLRVEVLQREEIEEKALMTPGDIAMLLNETSGLRVQVTSPSLGAANVRVQGLRGRYTQILADGLPLYGGQTGGIGLLQIPPLDLGQVEVIKGAASALYGASALGGVINLVSRRPEQAERELLVNRTSRSGSDAVLWLAQPLGNRWDATLLGGAHFQEHQDIDADGWSDLPGYRRAVVRPRFFWDDGAGRSIFFTAGATIEEREGGTIGDAVMPDGSSFPEELDTRRFDAGFVGRFLVGGRVASFRGSVMTQRRRHLFGESAEHERRHTMFGEAALTGATGKHAWALGAALEANLYRNREVRRFDYIYTAPALFVQDDFTVSPRLTLSGSGRVDFHSDYGTFFNPRLSALIRLPRNVTARFSTGAGVFAPTPFTEETEAVGLTNVLELRNLEAERAWGGSADLGWRLSNVEFNASIFGSIIRNPVLLRVRPEDAPLEIVNAAGPTRTIGSEFLTRLRAGDFGVTLTHTFTRSSELNPNEGVRSEVPLTPRHTVGIVGVWEREGRGRIGVEIFHTGRQPLDDNPYRAESPPYWVFGLLAEHRVGPARFFINAENLSNTRQTRYDPLVRPARGPDGRWTVDAWAPLEGRVINGGVRFSF